MQPSKSQLARILLRQELRGLSNTSVLWALLIVLSLLVGYSFIQAVALFSQASQTALTYPALAAGMNPLEGIFVPTFGAYYLVETLLLPFVIIRLLGQDQQNGTLKLLLQLPLSPFFLNGIKLLAMAFVWLLLLVPGLSAIIIWHHLGGALHLPEIICLISGHTLYTLTIITIAMTATAASDSLPTAAMICLTVTLGSWVLNFAAGSGGLLSRLSDWSFAAQLRQFENGLLSTNAVVYFLGLSLFCFISASILVHPGRTLQRKLKSLFCTAVVVLIVISGLMQVPTYMDLSASRKHSFNPADTRALRQMKKPLKITLHLTREDGRFYDFNHEILVKLDRLVPNLEVTFAKTQAAGIPGAAGDDSYGLIEYDYDGRHEQSYSNSPREVLPLLHALAREKVKPDPVPEYTGHPLVTDAESWRWWFYFILPLIFLLAAWRGRRCS